MTNEELQNQINNLQNNLQNEIEEIRYLINKKTGGGSSDIKANIVAPSAIAGTITLTDGQVDQAAIGADACGQSELKDELVSVTVLATATTGTATVTSGSVVFGAPIPVGNQDQFIDDCSVSGTILTITLAAAATANNLFQVRLLKS